MMLAELPIYVKDGPIECPHRYDESPCTELEIGGRQARCRLYREERGISSTDPIVHESSCRNCLSDPAAKTRIFDSITRHWQARRFHFLDQPKGTLLERFPPPESRVAGGLRWITGILHGKRRDGHNHLPKTFASIVDAGFPPPFIFAEPNAPTISDEYKDRAVRWPQAGGPVGIFQNSVLAMNYLWQGCGVREWDALLLMEDDTEIADGGRHYLDSCLWPSDPKTIGLIQPYCPQSLADGPEGWNQWDGVYCTAQAFVLSNFLVGEFIHDLHQLQRPRKRGNNPIESPYMDGVLAQYCAKRKKPMWLIRGQGGSSLVAHRGTNSTLGRKWGLNGSRVERAYADDSKRRETPCQKRKREAVHPQPCIHLGDTIRVTSKTCERVWLKQCNLLNKQVTQQNICESCQHYEEA